MPAPSTRIPLIIVLMGIGSVSMLLPAVVAGVAREYEVARPFLYGSIMFMVFTVLIGLAAGTNRTPSTAREHLVSLVGAYTLLPILLAWPFREAVPDTRFFNAYVEMVSSLTTTGATLFEPERLHVSLHLWRATVAWLGGFLMWVVAFSILAPLTLGGFEVTSDQEAGQGSTSRSQGDQADPSDRIMRYGVRLLPIYGGLTAILWLLLLVGGGTPAETLIIAMSTLSTSGITATGDVAVTSNIWLGEMIIFAFLLFAVSRNTFIGGFNNPQWGLLRKDRELRLAALFVLSLPTFLFFRHWLGAFEIDDTANDQALAAFWGGMFMVLSFLTTTGFESNSWEAAQNWSGLGTPGLLLAGIAVFGGGVATTAGGVKLLRVYALYQHGVREMNKLSHPSSVAGKGLIARRIRREGAAIAWVFFMLFAVSIAVVMAALALTGLPFEETTILSLAALTTTGPVANIATEAPISYADLPDAAKMVLTAAMVLGRLETLVIIALLNPDFWRG